MHILEEVMFGIGTTEILVILVVALLVIGPESLPKVARTVGKALGEFRKVSNEFQRTLNTEIALEEHEQKRKEHEQNLKEAEEKYFPEDSAKEKNETKADAQQKNNEQSKENA